MRKLTVRTIWVVAFLITGLIAGCGREQTLVVSPAVIATTPANGATDVGLNTTISATFNETMAPATINATTFTLTGPGAASVAGAVSYAGTIATFTPTVSLAANSVYIATITTGAQNPAGTALAANFVWSFTTGAPTVISTAPAIGATGVPVNTLVSATFSEAMDPTTITATTFTLKGPGATPVGGVVTYAGSTATFTPTVILATSTLYTATITTGAKDPAGAALPTNFVWTFTTAPPPAVVSTVPASGATLVAVNTPITATFNEPMNPATINETTFTLTGPGATPVGGVVSYAGSTATFTPTTVLTTSTLYTATITTGAKNPGGIALAANFVWTFTTAPPATVISTVPANGATAVPVNTLVSATFSEAMDPTTINGTTFTLTGPGATAVAGAVTYAGSTATFTPTTVLAANTLFTATITTGAKDPAGHPLSANYVWTFTTALPPTVVSTVPANGATGVAESTTVTATFSQAMNPATISGTTFTLTGPGTSPVPGAVTYAGTTATFTPAAALAANTLFTATITTGATDATGDALAANYVWTFSTAPPPTVTSTDPASAAVNVPINQKITATFSEPMSSATITTAGTFTVKVTTGGAPVAGVVTYDPASRTAIFTPGAALTASTQYTATITTAAQDLGGNALAANYVWSFTTGTVANATAPTILSTDPASAATAVPLNQKIAVTFSKAMDPATISAVGTFTVVVTTGSVPVPGAVAYDTASNTAIFTPSANLAASTEFTATISTAAKDLAGNALIAGGVPNPWSFTTGTTTNTTAPTVTLTNPVSAAANVPIDTTINATFSTAMNPATITTATFLVTETSGGTPVSGTVAYDVASQIATFTPSANLAASTEFTAAISPAAQDLAGNALAAGLVPNPWNFTTGTTAGGASPATINLGTAGNFAVMSTSSISSTGPVIINGDVGLAPGTSQGIPPAQVNGTIHINDPVITQAKADLLAAYNDAVSRSANAQTLPGNMGGLTFTPGLWVNSTSVLISGSGPTNDVTLDAQGDPNAVFIFKMGTTLTTAPASQVILAGGAKASNIFWQVGSSATIDTTTIFYGNVLAAVSITMNTGAVVNGRLFAGSGGGAASATVSGMSVTVPEP